MFLLDVVGLHPPREVRRPDDARERLEPDQRLNALRVRRSEQHVGGSPLERARQHGAVRTHLVQDDGRLLDRYILHVKRTNPANHPALRVAVDQTFHVVVLFGLAVLVGA